MLKPILLATAAALVASTAQAADIKTVFVIALENHNFTQPATTLSPQPIFGNPAAPFINSLVTPGNANAAMTSFASNYTNVPPQGASRPIRPSPTTSGPRPARPGRSTTTRRSRTTS